MAGRHFLISAEMAYVPPLAPKWRSIKEKPIPEITPAATQAKTISKSSPLFKRQYGLKSKILKRETNLKCPLCGEPLITRIARMYDLEDNLVLQPKAHCVKCVFQIKE